MPAAKSVDRKTALKRIIGTLSRLESDDERKVVLDAAVAYDTATRGETLSLSEQTSRRA